jgi:demethylmenaquinone methyltransferase/2-methoxy-6-polyprenyl-1,4-benzoquinol methylase
MTDLRGREREQFVREMFARIAPRYDLMNRLMSLGQDVRWRKIVIHSSRLSPGDRMLDLGAGTGDLAFETMTSVPGVSVVAGDFTLQMMQAGKQDPERVSIIWSGMDALHLPFDDECFDAVVSGFLMRNVIDLAAAMAEQYRLLHPGGRIVVLDTTRPQPNPVTPLVRFHMHTVIPLLGKLLTPDADAYQYLPQTSEAFLYAEELAELMLLAGFRDVRFQRLNFGTIAIHSAIK